MARAAITGTVLGAGLLQKRLESLASGSRSGIRRGLNLISADLLQRSADLAPIWSGDLIRSGRVRATRPAPDRYLSTVSYGTDHAVFTHFGRYNLGPISRRKPSTEDGPIGRMYLRRPFDRHADRYILTVIREAARGGNFRVPRRGGI